jgi:chaperonin GroES
MIMDSGHLASLGAGFIAAQNFRIKGGVKRMRPGEYQVVNFTGDDIRRGIVDLQFPGPSPVLFQMLGMLIEAGREITSVSNVMTGDAGRQNMPVGTTMALIEQGQMVFTASYKRIFRSMMDEFALMCGLNKRFLSPQRYQRYFDKQQAQGQPQDMPNPQTDFDLTDMDVQPVADPKAVTSMQRMGRAQFIMELANQGMIDKGEAMKRVLDAAAIDNPEALMPKPDPMAALMMQAQQEMVVIDIRLKEAELDKVIADTMATLAKAQKDQTEAELAPIRATVDQLRGMREALNARREEIAARSLGGMAGTPGDAVPAGRFAQGGGGQQGALASPALAIGGM